MENVKNLSAFTSKSTIRPELAAVYITHEKIVATDSFKLIEVKGDTGVSEACIVPLPKGVKSFDGVKRDGEAVELTVKSAVYKVAETVDATYPDYEKIIPTTEPLATVRLSYVHLIEVVKAFETKEGKDAITVELYGANRPVVLTRGNVRALIMGLI